MNSITHVLPNTRKYVLAVGAVAVLAIGALSFSALFASAAVGPTVNTSTTNANNATVTSAVIGTTVKAGAIVASTTSSTVPTGTVTFSSYANQSCTGSATVQSGVALGNGMASSSNITVTNAGVSYIVNYNGDANNLPSVSTCAHVATTSVPVVSPTTGPGTISGTFFNDINKDDLKNGSEVGLAGWTVWLHKGKGYKAPIVATTTTDVNGNYSFGNLINGTYFVEEQEKAGWKQTTDDTKVVLASSSLSAIVNFANIAQATSTGSGNHHDGKGKHTHKGKDKKDHRNDDNDKNDDNNGNHWGRFKR
jgi:hypothetical protein